MTDAREFSTVVLRATVLVLPVLLNARCSRHWIRVREDAPPLLPTESWLSDPSDGLLAADL